ncbi:MAG TPA: hypothetical protein VNN62_22655 [Methylomirabilota bacterium]|jgi:chromosome segregation ATPase|nr:hypothetical protein [Methylomirabilota bacterium]
MSVKTELAQALAALEEEYRFWVVESIALERGIDNLEEKIALHEQEIGPERAAELRARLNRTRERHTAIEERIRYVRHQLHNLKMRLNAMP